MPKMAQGFQLRGGSRAPKGEANSHDGTISTEKPDELWGKDGTTAQVVEEATVWIFGAIEH